MTKSLVNYGNYKTTNRWRSVDTHWNLLSMQHLLPSIIVFILIHPPLMTRGSRFHLKIWVGDLLSPTLNSLPSRCNLRLKLLTQWPWGIMRSCRGGRAKDNDQTIILTDIMISAIIYHTPSATHHLPPSAWLQQLSKSPDRVPRSIH